MKYYNLNNTDKLVTLKEAVLTGIQGNSGLFMPQFIPRLSMGFIQQIHQCELTDIAYEVARLFLSEDVDDSTIKQIVNETLNFDIPLVHVSDNIYALELFHGPTLAFKDVGARFMARLFAHFLQHDQQQIHILVATSGDTGGAVASAFWNVQNINVTILYPSGKVSALQEKQLTTLGKNIVALEVDGTFDDCQHMVKQAFADNALKSKVNLASANSINLARLIPQSFYYFWAYAQLNTSNRVVFCVPSGNFGNLTAGLMAKKMGLPIHQFIAATNANDVVPQYLHTGQYTTKPSVQTISNAMDVGNPSNFSRIQALYGNNFEHLTNDLVGYALSDTDTRATMKFVNTHFGYTLDPHGAVGYAAANKYLGNNKNVSCIVLETAHPAKFLDEVEATLGKVIEVPARLKNLEKEEKRAIPIAADYSALKAYLLGK